MLYYNKLGIISVVLKPPRPREVEWLAKRHTASEWELAFHSKVQPSHCTAAAPPVAITWLFMKILELAKWLIFSVAHPVSPVMISPPI